MTLATQTALAQAQPEDVVDNDTQTPAAGAPDTETLEITIESESELELIRESAQAVHVIDLEEDKRLTADMGEILARSQGVSVRRGGGLGSRTRFSLNGLTDDQIRFFLDGVPLSAAGYPSGISNVPVDLVQHVEVYRGVVPLRFATDALGGAVNLVTDNAVDGTHGTFSYQYGDFDTHRLALSLRHLHEPSGFLTRFNGFYDRSDNDYSVDVEVPNDVGRLEPATVDRFHDAYRAGGANLEVGLVDKPWAETLLIRAFTRDSNNELQNNRIMTSPYGEAESGLRSTGASVRYQHTLLDAWTADTVVGFSENTTHFIDLSEYDYNWFGEQVNERLLPGEVTGRPIDNVIVEDTAFARLHLGWTSLSGHELKLTLGPTDVSRKGDNRAQADPEARDPLSAQRDVFSLISGVELTTRFLDERLETIVFVKDYLQKVRSEEVLPGGLFRDKDRDTHRQGFGGSFRYRVSDWLYTKASYEHTTRLPSPEEIFGDGVLVGENLDLKPETSHNINVGLTVSGLETDIGRWRAEANAFFRDTEDEIVLLGNDDALNHQNVFGALSQGVELAGGWTSTERKYAVDSNVTYVNHRNTSSEGTFGRFDGDRIPNRPYLFANSALRIKWYDVMSGNDEVALSLRSRYVHEFFRSWESVGLRAFKATIPSQTTHTLALTYRQERATTSMAFTAEVKNITDEKAFDFFGVQRPGRSFHVKMVLGF